MLREALLGIGILLILGIYLFSRRQNKPLSRQEPKLVDTANSDAVADIPDILLDAVVADAKITPEPLVTIEKPGRVKKVEQNTNLKDTKAAAEIQPKIMILYLQAQQGQVLDGIQLYIELHEQGFVYQADTGLFTHPAVTGLLLLNAFKPGTLPEQGAECNTKGVSLVLELQKTKDVVAAVDRTFSIAQHLQSFLHLRLCDEQHSSLTRQTMDYLREQAAQYAFSRQRYGMH